MNLKTTLLLLVVVAVLGGLTLYFGGIDDDPGLEDTNTQLVENLPGGRVTKFELLLASQQDVTIEQRGDDWWMTSPFEDRASRDNVRQLMEALKSNPKLVVDDAPSRAALEAMKLEPPHTRVTLWGTEGDPIGIRIGDRDASGVYTNAMVEGDPALYRTGANIVNSLQKGRHEWRDDTLLSGDAAFLRRVIIEQPGKKRTILERPITDWQLVEPSPFQANASAVERLVNGLFLLKIAEFVRAQPQKKDLADVGLTDETAIDVTLDWGTRAVVCRFGPPEGGVEGGRRYVTDSERRHLFLVEGEALTRLTTPATEFRDPRVVRATTANVSRIRLSRSDAPAFEVAFDETARSYAMVEPFARGVDDSREGDLRAWLLAITAMRASEYLDRDVLGPGPNGGDPFDVLFETPVATLEIDLAERTGAARKTRIEFADGGDATYVYRPDHARDTVFVVPKKLTDAVLAADPRQFITRDLFPMGMLAWKSAEVTYRGKTMRLSRDPQKNAEFWRDPDFPDRDTAAYQQFLSELEGTGVLGFLPRGPTAVDGLKGDDAATLTIRIASSSGELETLKVTLGALDETGTTVVGTATNLPRNTVFRGEAWIRDHLVELFD